MLIMEPESPLSCSQGSDTRPCPEPDKFFLHPWTMLLYNSFWYCPVAYAEVFQVAPFHLLTEVKFCMLHFTFLLIPIIWLL